MKYKAKLDKTALVITVAITFLFVLIIAGQTMIIKETGPAIPFFTSATCFLIYFFVFLFRPIDYRITEEEVVIRRLLASVHIKRRDITRATLIDSSQIQGAIRTFGVGGMFGYWGSFANFSIGKMTWYVTRKDNPVLLTTSEGKKIVVSPNEPRDFLTALNA